MIEHLNDEHTREVTDFINEFHLDYNLGKAVDLIINSTKLSTTFDEVGYLEKAIWYLLYAINKKKKNFNGQPSVIDEDDDPNEYFGDIDYDERDSD